MLPSLRTKFLLLLFSVSLVALSAAFLLKTLIINDFGKYMDGESQDRVQHVIAVLESHYSQHGLWKKQVAADDLVWSMMMGLESRLYDAEGQLVQDTRRAVESLPFAAARRVLETTDYDPAALSGEFIAYPLFYKGSEVGRLEIRLLHPVKEEMFISSSNSFFIYTVAALGLTTLFLSFFAARSMAGPIREMSEATAEIASGNLSRRVQGSGPRELVSLANNFNRMADSLGAQEKLRRRLVSSAAHELRTPLAIISGELEGMIDGVLPVSREGLQSMHDEAARLTAILNGMDDLTRAEAATLNLNREEIYLKTHLEAIVGRFERLFSEKGAVILLDCPQEIRLFADPDRLSQIVINLVSNAHKAIPAGGRATVVAACQAGTVSISVADNGSGIPESDLPHIFERFYKGENGGLGLGLAIVQELAVAHGGSVSVSSRVGEGTQFRLDFPQFNG